MFDLLIGFTSTRYSLHYDIKRTKSALNVAKVYFLIVLMSLGLGKVDLCRL